MWHPLSLFPVSSKKVHWFSQNNFFLAKKRFKLYNALQNTLIPRESFMLYFNFVSPKDNPNYLLPLPPLLSSLKTKLAFFFKFFFFSFFLICVYRKASWERNSELNFGRYFFVVLAWVCWGFFVLFWGLKFKELTSDVWGSVVAFLQSGDCFLYWQFAWFLVSQEQKKFFAVGMFDD